MRPPTSMAGREAVQVMTPAKFNGVVELSD